ncbi:MAG: hypothetical protein COX57_05240 [Alphaproteobacteria bacterium CG_4_10_14_0_2_um_filter_63_37]|nr:MAG: hypothetical protein COX57_05240 [Alphaproteobacteria bacterium CG_4_10_14_0_2_um_filter_63_37]
MAKRLKTGEKVLFGIAVFFIAGAAVLWVVLESKDTPMEATTFWTFDEAGLRGQKVFQREMCKECHLALRGGSHIGLELDGIGSKMSRQELRQYLEHPMLKYGKTGHNGDFATDFTSLKPEEKNDLAAFLSGLKAKEDSPVSGQRPDEVSPLVKMFIPTIQEYIPKGNEGALEQEGHDADHR